MEDLRDLYQEVILDHAKKPRNFHEISGALKADGYNPLCGDQATVFVEFDGDKVKDASFIGKGCSISTASASMMTETIKGKTRAEVEALFERFHALVTGDPARPRQTDSALGKLQAFSGVCEFPVRVKCASLPWHTLRAALKGGANAVTTEATP